MPSAPAAQHAQHGALHAPQEARPSFHSPHPLAQHPVRHHRPHPRPTHGASSSSKSSKVKRTVKTKRQGWPHREVVPQGCCVVKPERSQAPGVVPVDEVIAAHVVRPPPRRPCSGGHAAASGDPPWISAEPQRHRGSAHSLPVQDPARAAGAHWCSLVRACWRQLGIHTRRAACWARGRSAQGRAGPRVQAGNKHSLPPAKQPPAGEGGRARSGAGGSPTRSASVPIMSPRYRKPALCDAGRPGAAPTSCVQAGRQAGMRVTLVYGRSQPSRGG